MRLIGQGVVNPMQSPQQDAVAWVPGLDSGQGHCPFTLRERRLLVQQVQELGPTEHEEIYNLLNGAGLDHMRNRNGVFFNLTNVPDELMHRLQTFVTFCITNKTRLDEYDKLLNERKLGLSVPASAATVVTSPMAATGLAAASGGNASGVDAARVEKGSKQQRGAAKGLATTCSTTTATPTDASPGCTLTSDPGSQTQTAQAQQRAGQQSVVTAQPTQNGGSVKFAQAKKKYSKRRVADGLQPDVDASGALTSDRFLIQ